MSRRGVALCEIKQWDVAEEELRFHLLGAPHYSLSPFAHYFLTIRSSLECVNFLSVPGCSRLPHAHYSLSHGPRVEMSGSLVLLLILLVQRGNETAAWRCKYPKSTRSRCPGTWHMLYLLLTCWAHCHYLVMLTIGVL